ncbi:DegQ family serine endoprotease [Roseomonas sp. NAR14]|uniref:Probable periplasmic serine endoprotease DegP-like n=1 Tax=Roseomonas acroporae TaxID=2937791 RepID=A0A9X1YB97_9PROT|nr:DegQ family serine endoprotease [Roseomonas acroporae]MCK8786547.1 DegQ family serine endoprotease [Roseomonas acroporae]
MSPLSCRRRGAALAAVLLAGTAVFDAAGWLPVRAYAQSAAPTQTQPGAPAVAAPQVVLPGFGDLVAKVRPAVVTITTTARSGAEMGMSPFPPGSPQDRMFRRYFGGGDDAPARQVRGLGSGFIVDADGYIVTNNHVVKDATEVEVTLDDGRELPARIVGRDPRTDLALLKVDAGVPLPFLNLGDSDRARPGDWVIAVGNPFGLGGTVTAGILSARGRDIHSGPYDDFLQIDAPINRGNSGGPLFALDGTVIGVNTAIFSPSGGSIGIGFAIPSNLVKSVVAQLRQNGHVERGYIGAMTQPVDLTMARALHLAKPEGALVAQVEENSPAARAGLQPGDVVTAVNDQPVRSPRDLARAVADLRPGTEATLTARRNGEDRQLSVRVAALQDRGADEVGGEEEVGGSRGRLGIALATVEEARRAGAEIPPGTEGAVVAGVRPGSPAAEAGLRPGDIITAVGSKRVDSPDAVVSAIRQAARANGGAVALRLLRDGQSLFVAVQQPGSDRSRSGVSPGLSGPIR